jgi:hypothetical protein
MSLLQTEAVSCPHCGEVSDVDVVYSVFADRRPDLRQAVLDDSLQRETCPHCGAGFRIEPVLTFLDMSRKLWLLLQPAENLTLWPELEQSARTTFDMAYGQRAMPAAQALGAGLQARVTFGWPALREKVLCTEHELDDVSLELTKLALIRSQPQLRLSDDVELRLTEVGDMQLVFCWINATSEQVEDELLVPRQVYDGIVANQKPWAGLRGELTAGPFVDVHRLLVPTAD